jgi:hypothetical protein
MFISVSLGLSAHPLHDWGGAEIDSHGSISPRNSHTAARGV